MSNNQQDSVPGVFAEARTKVTDPLTLLFEAAGSVAGVGVAAQALGSGAAAVFVGLVAGAALGWLTSYLFNVLVVWLGTVRRLRLALDQCLERRSVEWNRECEEFRRLARVVWEQLDAGFVAKGFFGLTAAVDSLRPLVSDAPWPDAVTSDQPDGEMIAEGALRDFAKRLYLRDGTAVFMDSEDVFAFEATRQELAFLVKRWASQLGIGGETATRLGEVLRDGLGATGARTVKLLWYVEEAKAAAIDNDTPDFMPWRVLRETLVDQPTSHTTPSAI